MHNVLKRCYSMHRYYVFLLSIKSVIFHYHMISQLQFPNYIPTKNLPVKTFTHSFGNAYKCLKNNYDC